MKQTPVKKRTAPKEDELWTLRREEILRVAAVLFAQGGYSDTDTQLLADRLGVGKGTIYRYFKSKEELFLAAVDQVMHGFAIRLIPVAMASKIRSLKLRRRFGRI